MKSAVRPYIMDLGSTNGTYLNNERLDPQRYYELLPKVSFTSEGCTYLRGAPTDLAVAGGVPVPGSIRQEAHMSTEQEIASQVHSMLPQCCQCLVHPTAAEATCGLTCRILSNLGTAAGSMCSCMKGQPRKDKHGTCRRQAFCQYFSRGLLSRLARSCGMPLCNAVHLWSSIKQVNVYSVFCSRSRWSLCPCRHAVEL